jgi:hypothetical protein
MSLDVKNIVDLGALTMGLQKAMTKYNLFIPFLAVEYAESIAKGAVNLGGTQQMLVQSAIGSFFSVLKMEMVINS